MLNADDPGAGTGVDPVPDSAPAVLVRGRAALSRRARSGRTRGGLLTVVAALLLGATAAHAQTSVKLVSNTAQSTDRSSFLTVERAQEFTTGSNSSGYKLTRVDIPFFTSPPSSSAYRIQIYSGSDENPGSVLGTLSVGPTLLISVTWTAPGTGIDLDPDTTYLVVLDQLAGGGSTKYRRTDSNSEDAGAANGWSLSDTSLWRNSGATTWGSSNSAWQIAIYGYAEETTKPVLSTAVVLGDKLTLTYNETLDSGSVPAGNAFTVKVGGSTVNLASSNPVAVSGSSVTLTLASGVTPTDTVTVSYAKASAGSAPNGPTQDLVGNDADDLTDQAVTNNTPAPPVFQSATVTGWDLAVTLDANLDSDSLPAGSAFTVTGNRTGTGTVSISDATVSVVLDSPVPHGESVTVSYTKPSTKPLQHAVGKQFSQVANFSGQAVTNNAPAAPVFQSATANGKDLAITFDKALDALSQPAGTSFTVTGGRTGTGTASVRGPTVRVVLDSAVTQGETVTVTYTKPGSSPLRDPNWTEVASFANESVANGTGLTPLIASVAIASTPSLDADGDGTADTYGPGETILVDVAMDEAVEVNDGGAASNIHVWLDMAPNGTLRLDANRRAAPFQALGRGGRIMRFQYTVQASDRDADGVFVQPDPNDDTVVFLSGGARVYNALATEADADLRLTGLKFEGDPRHRVDGSGEVGDRTPPEFSGATVDGTALAVTFDEPLDASSAPAGGAFTVSGGRTGTGTARISGATVTVTLDAAVVKGETVSVSYTQPASSPLQDAAGNAVASFSGQRVTNATERQRPVADAGDDVEVDPGARVTLDGSASTDPNGGRLTFAWTQTAGGTVTLSGADSARLSFTAPEAPGVLNFRLTVTDPDGLSDSDDVAVLVGGVDVRPPVADAGNDLEVDPGTRVTLDGSRSSDADGGPLTFAWTQTAGETVTPSGADNARLSFTAPETSGALTFRLTVTDPDGLSDSDEVTVTVRDLGVSFGDAAIGTLALTAGELMEPVQLPEATGGNGRLRYRLRSEPTGLAGLDFDPATRWLTGTPTAAGTFTFTWRATDEDGDTAAVIFLVTVNRAPAARAGDDLTVDPGAAVRLDGSGSSDPDGDILTFAWTQTLGAQVALSDAGYVQPSFTAPPQPERLAFRLTVTDPDGLSDTDEVTVTVRDVAPTFGDAEVAPLVLDVGHEMEAVVLPEAHGGNGALSYGLTSAPAGLAGLDFDPASRRLWGTPDAKGQYVFSYRAEDADGNRDDSDAALLTFAVAVQASTEARKRMLTRTLAAVGSGALSSALDTIGSRFADAPLGTDVTLAGQRLSFAAPGAGGGGAGGACLPGGAGGHGNARQGFGGFGQAGFAASAGGCGGGPGAAGTGSRDAGWDDLLHSSAFSLALGDPGAGDASVSRLGVWGGGDLTAFEGRPRPGSRYRGETRTGWLGIDARAGRWVAGLAVSHGVSESDYGFAGGEDPDERGRLETTLTTFHPYARWTLGNGLEVRGLAGAGLGAARHLVGDGVREASDLSMSIGSVGVRQALPRFAGVNLAVRADASFARLETGDGEEAVDGLRADIWRRRMGLEISRRIALGAAAAIEPFVESAMRRDGGDGLTGNGVEHLVGLRFVTVRLQLEARGRLLAVHTDEGARERGVSLSARFSPRRDGTGLSLALAPQWGAATGAAEALWQEEMPRLHGGAGRGSGTLDTNIGYGIGLAARGVLTPFTAARLTGYGRALRLGTRFVASQTDLDVELTSERRERGGAAPEHGVRLDLRLGF